MDTYYRAQYRLKHPVPSPPPSQPTLPPREQTTQKEQTQGEEPDSAAKEAKDPTAKETETEPLASQMVGTGDAGDTGTDEKNGGDNAMNHDGGKGTQAEDSPAQVPPAPTPATASATMTVTVESSPPSLETERVIVLPPRPHAELFSRPEWLEALIRVAVTKYNSHAQLSIPDKVKMLLEKHVLTHGNQYKDPVSLNVSIANFRAQIMSREVQNTFRAYDRGVYALFLRFATGVFPHQNIDLAGLTAFLELLSGCDLAPKPRQAHICWALARDLNLCAAGDTCIKYHEFMEFVIRLAITR